jgi:hypothetical protein
MLRAAKRSVLVAVLIAALAGATVAAGNGHPAIRFHSIGRAYQGKPLTVSVAVQGSASCSLRVRYADGATQRNLSSSTPANGAASWTWTVPQIAAPGAARLTVRCGSAQAQRTITVVGTLIPPKIVVAKSGYSIRSKPFTGDSVSYGIVLKNLSPNVAAEQVSVQTNFVMANNFLVGTVTDSVASVGPGSTYNVGGSLSFPGAAPVDHLEFVILIGAKKKAKAVHQPALDDVSAVPMSYDPAWVAWIQGEVVNDHPSLMLTNAQMSAVLFDAAGNVIGGGTGFAFGKLPPGTRAVFKIQSGVDSVPINKVASIAISVAPTYETPPP